MVYRYRSAVALSVQMEVGFERISNPSYHPVGAGLPAIAVDQSPINGACADVIAGKPAPTGEFTVNLRLARDAVLAQAMGDCRVRSLQAAG